MFQPFERFKVEFIDRLIGIQKKFLVAQTYTRASGRDGAGKIDVLFTDFERLGAAQIHLNAVKNDKYAAIIDLTNPKHKAKVIEMLCPQSDYRVFWAMVNKMEDIKKRIDLRYKNNIRRYVMKHTTWRIGADEHIRVFMETTFGELFLTLKRNGSVQTIRVKFEEIERA